MQMDIIVERHYDALKGSDATALVGVEVDGPGHNAKGAKVRDAKKDGKTSFYVQRVKVADMQHSSDYVAVAQKALSGWDM